jgi:hypothetical protein
MRERIKSLFRKKWFKIVLAVALIGVIVGLSIAYFTRDTGLHVKKLAGPDIETRKVADYKESRLYLNKNGTFVFWVNYNGENEFLGVGTYTKQKKSYDFIYEDMYRKIGPQMQQELSEAYKNWHVTYYVIDGRVAVYDPFGHYYHFK